MSIEHRALTARCMPIHEWPEYDRTRRESALFPGNIIDGEGPLANYRPMTVRFLDKSYGRALQWLDDVDELDPAHSPASRWPPECTRRYAEDLLRVNRQKSVEGRLAGLYYMLRALDPSRDVSHMRRLIASLRARHRHSRTKEGRIVAVDDLYRLGLELMATAPQRRKPRLIADQFRNGLLVSVVAASAVRTANAMMLTLGESFVQINDRWWIDLPPSASKNGEPILICLPEELDAWIAEYLVRYRPYLLRRSGCGRRSATQELWISNQGGPMSNIYQPIVMLTRRAFGKPVNPQLFRHCAATTIAVKDPKHVGIVGPLLTHRDPRSGRYYNLARKHEAARRWQARMLELRE